MKKKSIFRQMLIPMITVICVLAGIILVIFTGAYEKDIYSRNQDISNLLAGEIAVFMDGAYSINEELAENPSILTMETETQTPILAQCVERNTYLEQIHTRDGRIADGALPRGAGGPFHQMVVRTDHGREEAFYIQVLLFCCHRNALCIHFFSYVSRGRNGGYLCGGFKIGFSAESDWRVFP